MSSYFDAKKRQEARDEKTKLLRKKRIPVRGKAFEELIRTVLISRAKLPENVTERYLEHLPLFEQAFTSSSANPERNYEALEIYGDSILAFCMVHYITLRFPQLMNDRGDGVSTIARLKINLVSKSIFSQCAKTLGFEVFIASDEFNLKMNLQSLLEDVFEAFIGTLLKITSLIDPASSKKGYMPTLGPCYRILSSLLDSMDISLKRDDLYDPKTKLKEFIEKCHLAQAVYSYSEECDSSNRIIFTTKIVIPGIYVSGLGTGHTKNSSLMIACENLIRNLELAGYERPPEKEIPMEPEEKKPLPRHPKDVQSKKK